MIFMSYHILPVRVYYADTDAAGVVYHTAYIRFLEQARIESLRQTGIELHDLFKKYGILFAIKNIIVSYNKPARLDDLLYIKTKIKEIRGASLIYDQSIYLAELDGNMICSAEVKLVCVNANMQPCILPNIFKTMEIS
jgi:acyl-CoA thioester hydrolase